jgi:hypothetical protein
VTVVPHCGGVGVVFGVDELEVIMRNLSGEAIKLLFLIVG